MNTTNQSKHHSQSEDNLWMQKNNYPGEWLSEKSNEIINKIKTKHMKNLIFTLLLAPLFSFGQTYYDNALVFQNNIRSYYNAPSLYYSNDLSLQAQAWAEYLASTDTFEVSTDNLGENIFYIDKAYARRTKKDILLEASINWILDIEDDYSTFNQIIYPETTNIGFGMAENENSIYVVAKYDKLWK